MPARVLVVEDDDDLRTMMEVLLAVESYTVIVAENGQVALDRLHESRVDAIVLDLMMPVMDGRAFRRAQVADPVLANIPVIVVSTLDDIALDEPQTIRAFRKPVAWDDMLRAVEQACGER